MTTILVADDSPDDVLLLKWALSRSEVPHRFVVAGDGVEAQNYLERLGRASFRQSHPAPDLIFLDLNMPRRNGLQLLQWLNRHSEFKDIPVVMLSTCAHPEDISKAYELGALSFLPKPPDIPTVEGMLRTVAEMTVGK